MPATTCVELKRIARDFLEALEDPNDPTKAQAVASADLSVTHESYPSTEGLEQFLSGWAKAKQFMPNFRMELVDMVAEVDASGSGGKVWVFSKVTGGGGGTDRDSIDMMSINGEGKVWKTKDVQRITSKH